MKEKIQNIQLLPRKIVDVQHSSREDLTQLPPQTLPRTLSSFSFNHSQESELGWIYHLLSNSPVGQALLDAAQERDWQFQLKDLETGAFFLNLDEKILYINHDGLNVQELQKSEFMRARILIALAKGLRYIWQERSFNGAEYKYRPEDFLKLERFRSADADCLSIMIAWELRSSGYGGIWRCLLGGEDGDLAVIFGRALEKDPAALYNGVALSKVFSQWHEDVQRKNETDHAGLELLDEALYPAHPDSRGKLGEQRLQPAQMACLSYIPGHGCYLKEHGHHFLKDPFFSGLDDPVNQAHLFQIVYDSKITLAGGVPFHDRMLAEKIFPDHSQTQH